MPLNENNTYDYFGNDNPKCPHCDHEYDVADNQAYFLYNEDDMHEIECPSCEKTFTVSSRAKWTFDTDEQD